MGNLLRTFVIITAALVLAGKSAFATDKVRLVIGTARVFDSEHVYAAREAGIFKKHGLDVSITLGAGAVESLQTVIGGKRDVVWGAGALDVLAAYANGEPLRVLGSNMRGVADIFWYVKSDSHIQKFTDLRSRHELAYSRPGSITNLAVLYIKRSLNLTARLTAVGGLMESRRQVLAGQSATGWSVFPLNTHLVRTGRIRIIGTGDAAAGLSEVTSRVIAANASWLETKRDVAGRLMQALTEGQDRSYTSDDQLRSYAMRWKFDFRDVANMREIVKRERATYLPVAGLDLIGRIALANRKIAKPLSEDQLRELVHPLGDKPN